jgi:DNA-binding MarR family transcriptional regulator
MGLIERSEDPRDRRVRQVRLTAKGRGLVARGVEARMAWTRDLARRIPPRELERITEALERLTHAADAMDREASLPVSLTRSNG